LTVADQGTGIAPDIMERLFEPFFTTRAGTGTGLGLAVVHGVVAELGGAIDVQSAPGKGARFTLYLPESAADVSAHEASLHHTPIGAGQALMVVDDDPGLVSLTVEMLKGLGYEPVGFTDAGTAIEGLLADPNRFAAVITDEVMPRISGTQLAKSLRRRALKTPVLLVSGYGGALLASRAAIAGVSRVLTKPVQRVELAHALAEILD
jgi:CheY-like chemotaxis protein